MGKGFSEDRISVSVLHFPEVEVRVVRMRIIVGETKVGFLLLPKVQGKRMVKKIQFQENTFFMSLGQSASSVCLLSPGGRHKLEGETKPALGI